MIYISINSFNIFGNSNVHEGIHQLIQLNKTTIKRKHWVKLKTRFMTSRFRILRLLFMRKGRILIAQYIYEAF